MPFEVHALVSIPTFTTNEVGLPRRTYPNSVAARVLVDTVATARRARRVCNETNRVWIDEARTLLVTERQILGYEMTEVP